MNQLTSANAFDKIAKLQSLIFQFGKPFQQEKADLLSYFINHFPTKSGDCLQLHNTLLAMLAYPENKKIADQTQATISVLMEFTGNSGKLSGKLAGSGIFKTTSTECNFSHAMVKYLTTKFPGDVFLNSSSADSETIKSIFKVLLPSVEYASIHDKDLDLKSRIALFNTGTELTDIEWLLLLLDQQIDDEKIKEVIYSNLGIFIRCSISKINSSITFLRGYRLPFYFQSKPLDKKPDLQKIVSTKLPSPVTLTRDDKLRLIDAARLSLFYLNSETEPFLNANENDVTLFSLEGGISIALFGSKKAKRYSLESYIGYLALKNNIPIAYGGGWLFGHRCQFGINILEPFRGGESNKILCQLLRVYHQYFNASQFAVKPYQFGLKNPEGLKAGAFWFYYNLGFRPEDEKLQALALEEVKKKAADNHYRSDIATLKKFTKSNLKLSCPGPQFPSYDAVEISNEITTFINKMYAGNREAALKDCFQKLSTSLSVKSNQWKKEDLEFAKSVSLLFCMKPESESWIRKNKKNILAYIMLKSAPTERPWILHLQKFDAFWKRMI